MYLKKKCNWLVCIAVWVRANSHGYITLIEASLASCGCKRDDIEGMLYENISVYEHVGDASCLILTGVCNLDPDLGKYWTYIDRLN